MSAPNDPNDHAKIDDPTQVFPAADRLPPAASYQDPPTQPLPPFIPDQSSPPPMNAAAGYPGHYPGQGPAATPSPGMMMPPQVPPGSPYPPGFPPLIGHPYSQPPQQFPGPAKNKNGLMIAVIVALAALVLAIIVFVAAAFYFFPRSSATPSPDSTSESSPAPTEEASPESSSPNPSTSTPGTPAQPAQVQAVLKASPVDASVYAKGAGVGFRTPSGNIACGIGPGGFEVLYPDSRESTAFAVGCEMGSYPTPRQKKSCEPISFAGGIAWASASESSYGACSGGINSVEACKAGECDSTIGTLIGLPYGKRIESNGFACASTEDGLTCVNLKSGKGFFLSVESYRLY